MPGRCFSVCCIVRCRPGGETDEHVLLLLLVLIGIRCEISGFFVDTRPHGRLHWMRILVLFPASSPMTNTLSYSSAHNSKSTDTLRTITGMSNDDVFDPSSLASSSMMPTDRMPLFYLSQVIQALPSERFEQQQRLATAIKDVKAQDVTDFLK